MKKVLFGLAILMAIGTTVSASNASYCYKNCYDNCMVKVFPDDAKACNTHCQLACED